MSNEKKLLLAASRGDISLIKELLQNKVNVNAKNDEGQTSLHLAVEKGHVEIVKLLCEYHAEISIKDKDGVSVLLTAALISKEKKLVNYFLDKGLKFDCEIHEAAFKGDIDKIKDYFHDKKVAINTPDVIDNNAISYAAANGNLNIVQWLLKEGEFKVDSKNIYGMTILLRSAVNGQLEVVKWLVKKGGAKLDEKINMDIQHYCYLLEMAT